MLLLITSKNEPHANWIEAECERRGKPCTRFYPEYFPTQVRLTIEPGAYPIEGFIELPASTIPFQSITGIWHYLPDAPRPHPDLSEEFIEWSKQELNTTLQGLYQSLGHCRWVNPPQSAQKATYKLYQLRLAAHIGFMVPQTIVTNDPNEALAFLRLCNDQMVYKQLNRFFVQDSEDVYGVYVTLVTENELEENWDSVRLAPSLFQEVVPKAYELTIFVVGDYVWATAIDTQEGEYGQYVDYRQNGYGICRHRPVILPTKLEKMCRRMTRELGLRMCNFDLVYTPDGNYVFLDANPTEQWILIEELVGFPISTSVVDDLLGVNTLINHPYIKERRLDFKPNTKIQESQ